MGTHYSHVTAADRMSIQALLLATPMALASSYQADVAQARSQANRRAGAATRRKLGSDTNSPLWRTVLVACDALGRPNRSQANCRA